MNVSTKTFTDIDTLNDVVLLTQGETTFDATNNRYFNNTNLGITVINAQTGAIIDTIANPIGMKGIEFNKSFYAGILSQDNRRAHLAIYPNPFNDNTTLQYSRNFKNATLTVFNSCGQTVRQIKNINGQTIILHRDNLPSGQYFIRLTENDKIIMADKLVITD